MDSTWFSTMWTKVIPQYEIKPSWPNFYNSKHENSFNPSLTAFCIVSSLQLQFWDWLDRFSEPAIA